jgi:transcriptional regulator with GAF, ATPase, and Fis domain
MANAKAAETTRGDAFSAGMIRLTTASKELLNLPQAYAAVLDELQIVIPYDWASIRLSSAGNDDPRHFELALECGLALDNASLDEAAGEMFATRRPHVYERGNASDGLDAIMSAHDLRHLASAPFSIDNEVHGVIALASRDPEGMTPTDIQYLEAFAGLLSMLMTLSRTQKTIQRQAADSERLLEIGSTIALAGRSDDIITVTARAIATVLDTSIAIYIRADDKVQVRTVWSPEGHNAQHAEYKATHILQHAENPITDAIALVGGDHARSAIHVDVAGGERFSSLRDLNCSEIVVAPLEIGGRAIGAVAAFTPVRRNGTAEGNGVNVLATLPRFARYVSPSIQNSLLQHELHSLIRENEAVRRISQVAWQSANVEESVSLVARTVALLFDADMVVLVEMRNAMATWYHTYGSILSVERTGVLQLPNHWYQEKVEHLEEIVVPELGVDPPMPASDFPYLLEEGLVSFLAVPFRILDGIRGTLIIGYRTKRAIFSGDIRFAKSLTHGVAATLMIRRLQTELKLDDVGTTEASVTQ